jgi:hypothetical protein
MIGEFVAEMLIKRNLKKKLDLQKRRAIVNSEGA